MASPALRCRVPLDRLDLPDDGVTPQRGDAMAVQAPMDSREQSPALNLYWQSREVMHVVETFKQKGFVFLPKFLPPSEIELLRTAMESRLSQAESKHSLERRAQVKFVLSNNPDTRQLLLRISRRAPFLPMVTVLQNTPFIDHTKSLVKMPECPATPWHQDANYWQEYDPEFSMMTLWVALTPINKANGCMRFLEGSHQGPVHAFEKLDEIDYAIADTTMQGLLKKHSVVDCELEPGDAVVFHNKLVHSAYSNTTSAPRLAFKIALQDKSKRKTGFEFHPTKMEIPMGLEVVGGVSQSKPFLRRLADAARLIGPPVSTPVDIIKQFRRKRRDAQKPTITRSFDKLRVFQLAGSDREWSQLFFYNELLYRLDGVPGDVAEFGVAGGISLISMARILRLLERASDPKCRRMVYGFDSFEGLPELTSLDSASNQSDSEMKKGGYFDPDGYEELFDFANTEPNLRLIKGWFQETLPVFLNSNPSASFALVHIDCDLYESTKTVLDLVWDRVVPGGIIAFDELYHPDYPGETVAFRNSLHGKDFTLHQSRYWPEKKYVQKKS